MNRTAYAHETANIADAAYDSSSVDYAAGRFELSDPELVRIDRIRLISEPGTPFWDLSYAWGTLRDGRHVQVALDGMRQVRKGRGMIQAAIIREAREAGRFARALGMFDAVSTCN